MNQWDIFAYSFPEGTHPAVIISPDEQCLNDAIAELNVLFGASHRPLQRDAKKFEVILDESDGLDWKTAVRCHKFILVPKSALTRRWGRVSMRRQREIGRKIVEVFRLPL